MREDDGSMSRRDLLRWAGAAGLVASVPVALTACEPTVGAVPARPPAPHLGGLGFAGRPDLVIAQGGWCWFQAPRMAIDPAGRLWAGSTRGVTRSPDDGVVQLSIVNLATRSLIDTRLLARSEPDDHTSPSVFVANGRVQVAWSLHKRVDYLDLAEYDGLALRARQRIRRPESTKSPGRGMAYASSHIVDGTRWLLYRGEKFSWNLLTSIDGRTWTPRGLVFTPGLVGQRPYVLAASAGDRLHLVVSDGNPTEFRGTSAYAASIDPDFTIRDGNGVVIGQVGSAPPTPPMATVLVPGVADPAGVESADVDAWICDIAVADGVPTAVLSRRDPWPAGSAAVGKYRHQLLWSQAGPEGWTTEPLAWAGGELYDLQPDYCGLGAVDPTDASRVIVSTEVHPVTGAPLVSSADRLVHHELFEGRRGSAGGWTWTALTRNSTEDNLRPTVVASGPHKVLGWMRGSYRHYQRYTTAIVIRQA